MTPVPQPKKVLSAICDTQMRLEITAKLGGAAELDAAQFDTPPVNLFRALRTPSEIANQARPITPPPAVYALTLRHCVRMYAHVRTKDGPIEHTAPLHLTPLKRTAACHF